jgi:NDP-sugar pyrophosphorylase family protein
LVAHFAGTDVHVRVEQPEPLGTAGALANLRDWIDGRDVIVHNADAWHDADLRAFADGWDGNRMRLLVVPRPPASDFGPNLYAGVCLLPWPLVSHLDPVPSGLYEVLWRDAHARDELEFVVHSGAWFDCGTPEALRAANDHAVLSPETPPPGGRFR